MKSELLYFVHEVKVMIIINLSLMVVEKVKNSLPRPGFEPGTSRLLNGCSPSELTRTDDIEALMYLKAYGSNSIFLPLLMILTSMMEK